MDAQVTKAHTRKHANATEAGADAAIAGTQRKARAPKAQHRRQGRLRNIARRLTDGATELTGQASRQAHEHPLAIFGIAFAAGMMVARALRR